MLYNINMSRVTATATTLLVAVVCAGTARTVAIHLHWDYWSSGLAGWITSTISNSNGHHMVGCWVYLSTTATSSITNRSRLPVVNQVYYQVCYDICFLIFRFWFGYSFTSMMAWPFGLAPVTLWSILMAGICASWCWFMTHSLRVSLCYANSCHPGQWVPFWLLWTVACS